jgi:hypothetical protein
MSFRITGLSPEPFTPLFGLPEHELVDEGARRVTADVKPGFPDRIELRDAEPGESLLLVNYEHQSAATPYRSRHAIFVREGAAAAYDRTGEIPQALFIRPLSLRAFDSEGMMVDADLANGEEIEPLIERLFSDVSVAYIHAHFARRGCYAARIDRA